MSEILHLNKTGSSDKSKSGTRKFGARPHSRGNAAGQGHHEHRSHAPSRKGAKGIAEGSYTRAAAAQAVAAVENGQSLSKVLPVCTKGLDARDGALVQEIVYGTLRHRRLLTTRLKDLLEHPIPKRYENGRTLMLCALYQLVFTRMPAHAVVASSVGACPLCGCKILTGTVNAVLRRFLREGASLDPEKQDPAVRHSVPDWMYKRLTNDYPDHVEEILTAQNEHAPLWIRVETSKVSVADFRRALTEKEFAHEPTDASASALKLEHPVPAEVLPHFREGFVSVQDLAAQRAAPLIEPQPGDRILDCCSAPGGKSAHLLDLCPDIDLTCADADEQRLESAKKNFARLGRAPSCVVCDFAADDPGAIVGQDFDRILLDAPCSGTGVIRRHPDIKWLRRESDIQTLVATQAKMLDNALRLLKKGGVLVYTTCSILKAENEDQVKAFLQRHAGEVESLPFKRGDAEVPFHQALPGEDGGDGFFYSRFRKI